MALIYYSEPLCAHIFPSPPPPHCYIHIHTPDQYCAKHSVPNISSNCKTLHVHLYRNQYHSHLKYYMVTSFSFNCSPNI